MNFKRLRILREKRRIAKIEQGLKEDAEGNLIDKNSFAQYANHDSDELNKKEINSVEI